MADAEGWHMPQSYKSLVEEHLAARSACAVFDISYASKFRVRGNGALSWLESMLSQQISECQDGASMHALVLNDEGKIIDKVTLLRESAGSFWLIGHASVEAQVQSWLESHKAHAGLELSNETEAWCGMALIGPQSARTLSRVLRGVELPAMHRFTRFVYQNQELLLGRLGLNEEEEKEVAYEFFCPALAGISWFESFIGAGAQPCGTATRECLRMERGCVAVGKEISCQTSPGEAGLKAMCSEEKNYHGAEGVDAQKSPSETVARLRCTGEEAEAPEPGNAVRDTAGATVGRVTSVTYSPALGSTLAMALVSSPLVQPGVRLVVMVQGRAIPVVVM